MCECVCVCLHMHLFCGLGAQMYTHLTLNPAVKLQQGLKDPPHWLLRKSPQETHTHTHTQWLVRNPAGNCTGEFLPGQGGLFSPLLPVPAAASHLPPEAIVLNCETFKINVTSN